jgi:predicted TIM-barrel fold metal-dependent hydrolase
MKEIIGRRGFLGKAASTAMVPLMLQGGSERAPAQSQKLSAGTQKTASKKRKIIALEAIWGAGAAPTSQGDRPISWLDETRKPASPERLRAGPDLGEYRLKAMDEVGITMQVISPGQIQAQPSLSTAIDMAKKRNDRFAELIGKHPDRFAGFAALPLQDPKAAADELERGVKQLGLKGTMISAIPNYEKLDEQKWWVLWERAADLGVPIYIHPTDPAPEFLKMYDGQPALLGSTYAWGVETATHAMRVLASGIFDAYPKAIMMLGHIGEGIPALLGRMDREYGNVLPKYKKTKKTLSAYFKENCVITTSSLYYPEALTCAISAIGIDRVCFSDDFPSYYPGRQPLEHFEKTPMSDADREKIYHLNAERILKL